MEELSIVSGNGICFERPDYDGNKKFTLKADSGRKSEKSNAFIGHVVMPVIIGAMLVLLAGQATANTVGNLKGNSAPYNIADNINISANGINNDLNKPNMAATVSAGFLPGWNYRKQMTINGTSAGAQTNYQMNLTVYNSIGNDTPGVVYLGGNARSDFGDLRFTKSDGVTLLDYWIESYTPGVNATIWVKVDSIPASPNTTSIYLYYGNPSATSASNGTNTFLLFDDFLGSSLDTSKWSLVKSQGTMSITGSIISLQTNTLYYNEEIHSQSTYSYSAVRYKARYTLQNGYGSVGYINPSTIIGDGDIYTTHITDTTIYPNGFAANGNDANAEYALPLGISAGVFNTFEIIRDSARSRYFQNDVLLSTLSLYPTADSRAIYIAARNIPAEMDVDWILVRNYASSEPAWAPPPHIFDPSGYVFNLTGSPIEGATATLSNATWTAKPALSDINGYWSTKIYANGTYNFNVSKEGYIVQTGSAVFASGGDNFNLILLSLEPTLLYSDFYSTDAGNPTNITKGSKVHFYYSTAPNADLSLRVEGSASMIVTDKADYTGSGEIEVNFPYSGSYTVYFDKVNGQTIPNPQKYFFKATYDRFDLSLGFTPEVTVNGDIGFGSVDGSVGESTPRSITMRYNGDGTFSDRDILGTGAGLETSREVTAGVNVGEPSPALGPLRVEDIGVNVHINEAHGYGFETISNDLTRADLYYGTGILTVPNPLNPVEPVYYEPIIGNILQIPVKPYAEFNNIGAGLSGEGEACFDMPYDNVGLRGSGGFGIEGSDNIVDQKREISLYAPWEIGGSFLAWDKAIGGETRSTAVYNFNGEFDSLRLSKSDTSTDITGIPEALFLGGIGKEADSETAYTISPSEIAKINGIETKNFVNSQTNTADITLSPQTMLDEISASPIKGTYEKSGITGDINTFKLPLDIDTILDGGGIDIELRTDLLKEKLYESGVIIDKIPVGWIERPIVLNPHIDYDLNILSNKYLSVLFNKTQIENAISSKLRNLKVTRESIGAVIIAFFEPSWQHDLHIQVVDQYGRIVGFNSTTNSSYNNIPGALILKNSTIDNVTYKEVIIVPSDIGITAFVDARQAENLTETYNLTVSQFDNSTNSPAITTVAGNITEGTILKFRIQASNGSFPSGSFNVFPVDVNVSSINVQATSNLSINITNITKVNESALYETNDSIYPEILSASYEPLNVRGKSAYKIVVNASDNSGRKPLVFLEVKSSNGNEAHLMSYNRSTDLYVSYWIPKFVGNYTPRVKAYTNIKSNGTIQDLGAFTIKRNVSSDFFRLNNIKLPYNITYYRNGSVIDEIAPDAPFDIEFGLGNVAVLLSNVTAPGINPTSPPGISLFENLDLEMNGTTYTTLGRYIYINPVSLKKYLGPNSIFSSMIVKISKPDYPFIATKSKEKFYKKGLGTAIIPDSNYTISNGYIFINTTYSPLFGVISTYPDISVDRVRIYGENKTFGNLVINATISNKGIDDVKGVYVEFLVNGFNMGNESVDLPSGSSRHIEFNYLIRLTKDINISIVADPFNAINEVNKVNNKYSVQVNVSPAPEVAIGFNTTSKDFKIYNETGTDANYLVLPSYKTGANIYGEKGWELRQYTLHDQDNNALMLILKHKKDGKEAAIEIISMQYNDGMIIAAPENSIKAEYSEDGGLLKELEQKIEVPKFFDAEAKYSSTKNQTEIKMNIEGQDEQQENGNGVVILELLTDKGGLKPSY